MICMYQLAVFKIFEALDAPSQKLKLILSQEICESLQINTK